MYLVIVQTFSELKTRMRKHRKKSYMARSESSGEY